MSAWRERVVAEAEGWVAGAAAYLLEADEAIRAELAVGGKVPLHPPPAALVEGARRAVTGTLTEPERQVRHAPVNQLETAGAAGMELTAQLLTAQHAGPVRIVMLVQAEHPTPGELNAATCAINVDGPGEILSMLLEHAAQCGQAIGLQVEVLDVGA